MDAEVKTQKWTSEYRVQPDGSVLELSKWRSKSYEWRKLSAKPNSHGYLRVHVYHNGKRVSKMVHLLVAQHFLSPKPSGESEVRHLDGNRENNDFRNLAWGTAKENADDRERHGRTVRGIVHPRTKLSPADVITVRSQYVRGAQRYQLARHYGISETLISMIIRRDIWKQL